MGTRGEEHRVPIEDMFLERLKTFMVVNHVGGGAVGWHGSEPSRDVVNDVT